MKFSLFPGDVTDLLRQIMSEARHLTQVDTASLNFEDGSSLSVWKSQDVMFTGRAVLFIPGR